MVTDMKDKILRIISNNSPEVATSEILKLMNKSVNNKVSMCAGLGERPEQWG